MRRNASRWAWVVVFSLAISGACASDSDEPAGSDDDGDNGSSEMDQDSEAEQSASGEASENESEEPEESGSEDNDTGTAGSGAEAMDEEMSEETAGDEGATGETGGAQDIDCDADPHNAACIDTHVRGQCGIDTGFPGDEACLLPPPPGEGIQIHVGPEDYGDPDEIAKFIFEPGMENSLCWSLDIPTDEDIYYQGYVLSGRPGTHHIINTGYTTPNPEASIGVFTRCRGGSAGTSDEIAETQIPGASKPYMPRFAVAPENEGLGYPIAANMPMQSDMHYFNYTDEPILREYWLNLYTIPAEQVTEQPNRIRGYGGITWFGAGAIQPGTDTVYNYKCPIEADGRITALLGHTHSHAVRFTAWVARSNGERLKVFESFDYLEPKIYAYNSVEENPPLGDPEDGIPGAYTGILEVNAGDELEWECHVINDDDVPLTFTNFVDTGEMCNIWGQAVGPRIDCNR